MRTSLAAAALLCAAALPAQNQGITLTNGIDGYVEIPYSAQVVPQAGLTLEAWITYDDTTLPTGWRYPTVFRQNLNANTEDYFLRVEANNNGARVLRWRIVTTVGIYDTFWPFLSGQLNTWTHVAGSYDGTTSRFYVNGAQVASIAASGTILDRGGVLRIGKGSDIGGPIEVWNGSIDEARMWPFGLTAAEVKGAMNARLSGMPGNVSTWNLDGAFVDSSSTLHATATGTVNFTSNVPVLQSRPFLGAAFGASSQGCLGAIPMALAGVATSGNAGFGLAAQRVPAAAQSLLVLSPKGLPAPINLLGVGLWVDVLGSVTLGATASPTGALHVSLPIPAGLIGSLAAQCFFVDTCGSQGLTASNGLTFAIVP